MAKRPYMQSFGIKRTLRPAINAITKTAGQKKGKI